MNTVMNTVINAKILFTTFDFSLKVFSIFLFTISLFYESIFFVNQIIEFLNFMFILIYIMLDIYCIAFFIFDFNIIYHSIYTLENNNRNPSFLIDNYYSNKIPFIRSIISLYFFFIFIKLSDQNFALCFKYNIRMCFSIGIIIFWNFITLIVCNIIDIYLRKKIINVKTKNLKIIHNLSATDLCSICIDDKSENKNWIQLDCKHKFHSTCIYSWFEKSFTCPNCRALQ